MQPFLGKPPPSPCVDVAGTPSVFFLSSLSFTQLFPFALHTGDAHNRMVLMWYRVEFEGLRAMNEMMNYIHYARNNYNLY